VTGKSPVPSKQELVKIIRDMADKESVTSLSQRAFMESTGLSQWSIYKHFDTWSDACEEAGITTAPNPTQLPREQDYTDAQCVNELKRVAALLNTEALSSKQFRRYGRISASTVSRRFGSWGGALAISGLKESARTELARSLSPDYCIEEMKRVANKLGHDYLTAEQFDEHGNVSAYRIVKVFGSWHKALSAAGLNPSPNFKREVPFTDLADDFLNAAIDVGRVPSLVQLTRRSRYVSHTFSGRHGGYDQFKRLAIEHLFSNCARIPQGIREFLETEHRRLTDNDDTGSDIVMVPHRRGRTLNFRAFAYSPTSEHDVVQLFGAVADELGFEIVGNRSAFPDCEARRRSLGTRESFVPCLIEYEFASSDFRRHKHPVAGCDLIVCWTHDWRECPIEVLELSTAIKSLDGWR